MSTARALFGLIKKDDYFVAKPCTFKVLVDGLFYVEPQIIQPLAKGAEVIAKYYSNKYGVNIVIIDHSQTVEAGYNLTKRFQHFCQHTLPTLALTNNSSAGFILMHSDHHAVPVVISRENDKNYMIVFDSTSDKRKKGYIQIANLVPDYYLLLNDGTRQADNGSCVTDALAILKRALRINQLATNLITHKFVSIDTLTPSPDRQSAVVQPKLQQNNMGLFNMPEVLLITAQISKFVENADADLNVVINTKEIPETLGQRRARDDLTVSFNRGPETSVGINSYLFKKSRKHADIITAEINRINNRAS